MTHPRNVLEQFDLSGDVALVTGAGGGIGRAYAEALAGAGAAVACVDVDADGASETADRLDTTSLAIEADVTDEAAVAESVARTVAELGGLDAAFANAGIGGAQAPITDYDLADWRAVLDVNLTGVFLTCREAARAMRAADGGSIVSTASIYGHVGSVAGTSPAYSAAKGGVVALTRELAVSLAPHGIRANAIAPGFVDTDLLESGIADLSEAEREGFDREIERRTLLGRRGEPEELMGLAVFLASEASSYVTGQSFPVDGGWLAQ